ncbi:MAG: hypothetical protein JF617_09195 [Burkholderiales bacterium]|uniref:Tripartite-type tricarboxylate transporter receptor subunit TctC n=1 Tax=Variovorax paradoxus TaxID=34073 RepID=A0AAW8EHF3_VARPD|nr:hypothetical protein [Burkholderiales bacterium]MDP9972285.1 tripartite-type tricarboxylate transporter receptor subunit TctC [Variovorax paradoxus]
MKRLFTIAMAALAALPAFAECPDKSITIVVPLAAGGPTDKVAHDFAEAIRKPLGNVDAAMAEEPLCHTLHSTK